MSDERLRRAALLARSRGPSPEAVARMQTSLKVATAAKSATIAQLLVKPWIVGSLALGVAIAGAVGLRHHREVVREDVIVAPVAATTRTATAIESHDTASAPEVPTIAIDELPRAQEQKPVAKAVASAPVEAPETELALVQSAQSSLATDPARALAFAERHATKFPHGELAQEREVTAIEALAKLGRADEAKARGERFLSENPHTPYRLRIERATKP